MRRFTFGKPLTESPLRRLPEALKGRLYCPDGSVGFLERLYSLEDPRGKGRGVDCMIGQ